MDQTHRFVRIFVDIELEGLNTKKNDRFRMVMLTNMFPLGPYSLGGDNKALEPEGQRAMWSRIVRIIGHE